MDQDTLMLVCMKDQDHLGLEGEGVCQNIVGLDGSSVQVA